MCKLVFECLKNFRAKDLMITPPPPSALKIGPVGLLERIQHKGSPMIPILFVFCTVVARNGPQWDRIN